MLIPLGDSLKKRSLPFMGIAIIAVNFLVGVYQLRIYNDEFSEWRRRNDYSCLEAVVRTSHGHEFIRTEQFMGEWGLRPIDYPDHCRHQLVTHQFLHGNAMHWIGNMMTLWLFLPSLEAGLGRIGFFILYFASGIAGGAAHCSMNHGDPTPMIGASGAISGVIGAYFVAFGGFAKIHLGWNAGLLSGWRMIKFSVPAGVYVFFWLVVPQIAAIERAVASGEMEGIAWFAHAGGFFTGLTLMLICRSSVLAKLQYNREGELWIGDTEESLLNKKRERLHAKAHPAGSSHSAPASEYLCSYCGASLMTGIAMGETLVRCPEPDCRYLNYLSDGFVFAENKEPEDGEPWSLPEGDLKEFNLAPPLPVPWELTVHSPG